MSTAGDPHSPPTRPEIDRLAGPLVLEFGASWCGHCLAMRATVEELREQFPDVEHLRVEDGPGKPLGRSFRVKLWPTFVFMHQGVELQKLVRPRPPELREAFAMLAARR